VVRFHGAMVMDIPKDIKNIPSKLDPPGALKQMEEEHKKIDTGAAWTFRNEEYGVYIYFHNDKKVHVCYVVSFFADTEYGNPSQPIFFIDAKNGKVLHSFDMLRYCEPGGVGPGGNLKVGYYYYGTDYPPFLVSVNGSTCTMDCPDVKTVDLNHGTSGTTPFSYTCYENTHEAINGGYCPLNDAQFFGQQIYNMYQAWYVVPVLPFQLMMRVHYSTNYENIFWDGSSITFGDGYTTFYPLVALDITAHEVSHGFTQYNSNLDYDNGTQAGGINESFSDMAGEAAEYYVRGTNDFMFAFDIFKNPTQALRYLYDPPLDGISIDHVDDYYSGMDVHYSCGIFNKAFSLIATSPGWNPKMAFDIFTKANQDYWVPSTNFQQGAESALEAAVDYGYSTQDVIAAFTEVGIILLDPGSPEYCASSGTSQFYEYIAAVQVGDLNNTSGPSPYSDFTHLVAHINQGETPTVSLTPGFTGPSYTECWNIWIDYNGDHDFDDTGEHVFTGSGNDVVTGSFIEPVPPCTVESTRMRVSMSYAPNSSFCPPNCGTFTYGEVEDYTVEISGTHPPVANFGSDYWVGCTPFTVNFTDNSTNNPTSWEWDFGDNGTSREQNPPHIYTTAGEYTVILTVTNPCGCDTISIQKCIIVLPSPVADFTASSTYISVYESVNFTDQSTGDPTSWDWTFEGGAVACITPATSTDQNPTGIEYYTAGNYDVTLTATSLYCGGDTETKVDYITVVDPYCASSGILTLLYTSNVVVADLDNPSGASPYSDFSQLCAHLTQGKTYPVSLQNSGIWFEVYGKIWIDYNRDYDFDDEGEEVFSSYGASSITGSLSVPCDTIIGATRMRVSIWAGYEPPYCGGFSNGEVEDYTVCISPKTTTGCTAGYIDVFPETCTDTNRGAQSFIMPEDGTLNSISMYHDAGSGDMILAVHEGVESPQYKIAETDPTTVSDSGDWQSINLKTPLFVKGGAKIWLAWVYENNPGIRREVGIPPAHRSEDTWSGGMPDLFGCSDKGNYIYSIYAEYTPGGSGEPPYKRVGNPQVYQYTDNSSNPYRYAESFIMPEAGTIISVSMYHDGGIGDDVIFGMYGGASVPGPRLAVTPTTPVCRTRGWQTIDLTSSVEVSAGTKIWLAWVFENNNPGIKYNGMGSAYRSDDKWLGGMPDPFGSSTQTSLTFSVYANYTVD